MGRTLKRIVERVALLLLALALVAGGMLWQLSRDLPAPACRWLERRLSQGPFGIGFKRASFHPWRGVCLQQVWVHPKRDLGPPLLRVGEIRVAGRIRHDRPPAQWVDAIHLSGLDVPPFHHWPVPFKERSMLDWAALFDPAQPLGALLARPVRVVIAQSRVFSVEIDRAEGALQSDGSHLFLDGGRCDFAPRRFRERVDGRANFAFNTSRLQASCAGTMTPETIEALCLFLGGDRLVTVFHDVTDHAAPLNVSGSLSLDVPLEAGQPLACDMRVSGQSAGLRFRGVPFKHVEFALQWLRVAGQERRLTVAPVVAETEHGRADLALAYYPGVHLVDFSLQSTLPAATLAAAMRLPPAALPAALVIDAPPHVVVSGTYAGPASGRTSRMQGWVACDAAAYHRMHVSHMRADFSLRGTNQLAVSGIQARCYGGDLAGDVRIEPATHGSGPPRIGLALRAERIDLAGAMADTGVRSTMDGKVSGQLELAFPWDTNLLQQVQGRAQLRVEDGAILRIPVFAGLTDFLGRNVPGVDALLMQSDATLPVVVSNGLARIENFKVEGNLFSLAARGQCRLTEPGYPIDGVTQLRFFKQKTLMGSLARLVTLPVSKMMEFRIAGSLRHPEWSYITLIDRLMDAVGGEQADAGTADSTGATP